MNARLIRYCGTAGACAASTALAAWAVWHFAPGAFASLSTLELAALLGLLALPALTLGAIWAERRTRRESAPVETRPEARRIVHPPALESRPPPLRSRSVDMDAFGTHR